MPEQKKKRQLELPLLYPPPLTRTRAHTHTHLTTSIPGATRAEGHHSAGPERGIAKGQREKRRKKKEEGRKRPLVPSLLDRDLGFGTLFDPACFLVLGGGGFVRGHCPHQRARRVIQLGKKLDVAAVTGVAEVVRAM